MTRKLLATTALAILVASGALAQETTTPAPAAPTTENAAPAAPVVKSDGSLISNIIGESVYNGTADDAQSIGKVTDVVFDKDGQAKSIVLGVGGFLGVGQKDVAVPFDALQVQRKANSSSIDKITVSYTKDQLTNAPKFAYYQAQSSGATTGMGSSPAGSSPMTRPAGPPATAK